MAAAAAADRILVCDAHMHCWDQHGIRAREEAPEGVKRRRRNEGFNNQILGDCGTYLPEDYVKEMVLEGGELQLRSVVHVEAFPTDQVKETEWVDSLSAPEIGFPLVAIVANANISLQPENEKSSSMQRPGMEALEEVLHRHRAASTRLRGIRWVLNHEPSWPQVHRGDYWTDPQFRAGFSKLEEHGLSFDLQLNPHQLADAANFFRDFPNIPVVVDHAASLKLEGSAEHQEQQLEIWRTGMRMLAVLPQVYVKLSMLSYTVPDFWTSPELEAKAKQVVREAIDIFGAERCMFASNFPAEPAGDCRRKTYRCFKNWVSDLPAGVQDGLFYRNAERFYRIEVD